MDKEAVDTMGSSSSRIYIQVMHAVTSIAAEMDIQKEGYGVRATYPALELSELSSVQLSIHPVSD